MFRSWAWRSATLAFVLSGFASSAKICEKPDQTTYVYEGKTVSAPEGCKFSGNATGPVRAIVCDDGREGLAIADVSNLTVGIGG